MVTYSGGEAFVTAGAQGYQSIATLTVKRYIDGVEDTSWTPSAVIWSVTSSSTALSIGEGGVWKRDAAAKHGLIWVASDTTSVDGTIDWDKAGDEVNGTAPTGTTAYLADIVGSRTVTVTASEGGETSSAATITFGAGPLSVFNKADTVGKAWSASSTDSSSGGFQDTANIFPAPAFCGGSNAVNRSVTTNSDPEKAGFDNADGWSDPYRPIDATVARYATNSKMAKTDQLLAVARYNASFNSGVLRKGAAPAAGWTLGSRPNYAWSGEIYYAKLTSGNFAASYVNLTGNSGGHSDWQVVHTALPMAVCVP